MMTRRKFLKKTLLGGAGLWIPVGAAGFLWKNYASAAPTIVHSTANGGEQHISISNGAVARALPSFSGSWNTMRIGIRYIFSGSSNLSGTPHFSVGLCHGTTNILGDATCDNFLGVGMSTTETTWTFFAAGGGNMGNLQTVTNKLYPVKKVNTTTTVGTQLTPTVYFPCGANQVYERMHIIDLVRGSPNWTVVAFMSIGFLASTTPTDAEFLTQMKVNGTPVYTGHGSSSPQTIAFDETAGVLDTVNIWWDQTADTLEISGLAVNRIAQFYDNISMVETRFSEKVWWRYYHRGDIAVLAASSKSARGVHDHLAHY